MENNLNENELLAKIYKAQQRSPCKNDWCLQVKQDLVEFGILLSEKEIKATSKKRFKDIVKESCKRTALKYLLDEKAKVNRKMGKLSYSELKMQDYLQTNLLNTTQKKILYKLRVRMINVSNNMGVKVQCFLCREDSADEQNLDSQEHLLVCPRIKDEVKEIRDNTTVAHDDIYSDNIMKQKAAVVLFQKAIRTRSIIMSNR